MQRDIGLWLSLLVQTRCMHAWSRRLGSALGIWTCGLSKSARMMDVGLDAALGPAFSGAVGDGDDGGGVMAGLRRGEESLVGGF